MVRKHVKLVFVLTSIATLIGLTMVIFNSQHQFKEKRFRGVIESIEPGCWVDSICTMSVSGTNIIFGRGWSRSVWGEVTVLEIGKLAITPLDTPTEVDVYCRVEAGVCTLEGNENYYIKPVTE